MRVPHISDFIDRYSREFDFYEEAARKADALLTADLSEAGVRCIVSNRAKSIDRLEAKCRQRNAKRLEPYSSVDEIVSDIVDLAGVRVALYFPGHRIHVDGAIKRRFDVLESKDFPEGGKTRVGNPRFSGYSAMHYRVKLRTGDLGDGEERFSTAKIGIQVASVFMHGWAEVEHDLVYKPATERLSEEEYALLDQLNGLAIAAEIGLERLQRANERRVAEQDRKFGDRYELTTYLIEHPDMPVPADVAKSGLGRIDWLFELLTRLGKTTPAQLDKYLSALHDDLERRPLAEQVIDNLLAGDDSRYEVFSEIQRGSSYPLERGDSAVEEPIGMFLSRWIDLERFERDLAGNDQRERRRPVGARLRALELAPDTRREFDALRRMRNDLVHGIRSFDAIELLQASERLDVIINEIRRRT